MTRLSDGSGLAFTVREYFSPLGLAMGGGIVPEIEVRSTMHLRAVVDISRTRPCSISLLANYR